MKKTDPPKKDCETQPPATIQVDLDGAWAIRRCYGDRDISPSDKDAVYSEGVPLWLELLADLGMKGVFFVVGCDADVDWKMELLRKVVEQGHEIGNHSMTHTLDLASQSAEIVANEVDKAQRIITEATGFRPRGFKAPGYSISDTLIGELENRGFLYDTTLFPTPWGIAMRGVTRWISKGKGENSATQYGGHWSEGRFQKLKYVGTKRTLVEMPICVTPVLRVPFHGSFALALGDKYFRRCLTSFRLRALPLNYTLHGVDLTSLGAKELTGGRGGWFFRYSVQERLKRVKQILRRIEENYKILTAIDVVEIWKSNDKSDENYVNNEIED